MKNWEIEQYTKDLKAFENPKRSLEQYMTQYDQASIIMQKINVKKNETNYLLKEIENLEGKVLADFGAGTGMLGFTSLILGVEQEKKIINFFLRKVYFYEIDEDAVNLIRGNGEILQLEEDKDFEVINIDIFEQKEFPKFVNFTK